MASTFTTSFGIEKIATGEQAGAWGTTTNHNADILDRIASYTAVALSGTTHTLTVREASPGAGTENLQDGMYRVIKFTGALGANNTVTIAPNTSKAWFIVENATTDSGSSGPYSVILTQGSGANITLQNGKNAIVYCDGAGSGAVVFNALNDLQMATLEVTGAAAIDGLLTAGASVAVTGNVTTTGTVEPAGDTSAADNAAIGYTAAEGLVLTGQGATNDVTIKNDADGEVMGVLTGTTTAAFKGQVTAVGAITASAGVELGHATDTTITRASAGNLNIEGNVVYRAGGTDVPVADGGTGVSTLTDGGILLGSGTGAITAMAVLADGEIIVGDGTTDPVAESGATARTSLGAAALGANSDITSITGLTTDLTVAQGGTGAGTFTDGGILLGSGTGAITAMAVLASGEMIVGDGTTDPGAVSLSGDVTINSSGVVTIAATSVEGSMLNTNVISGQTALTSGLALTDELLVSDAGTLKRMDISLVTNIASADATALAIALG